MANKKPSKVKKVVYWIIAILVFYIFTTARASTGIVEIEQKVQGGAPIPQTVVVEKIVKTTKYNTTKVPFGEPRCEQLNYNYSFKYSYTRCGELRIVFGASFSLAYFSDTAWNNLIPKAFEGPIPFTCCNSSIVASNTPVRPLNFAIACFACCLQSLLGVPSVKSNSTIS